MKRIVIAIFALALLSIVGCKPEHPKSAATVTKSKELVADLEQTEKPTIEPTPEPTEEPAPEPTESPSRKTSLERFQDAMNEDDYDSEYHRLKDEVKIIKNGLKNKETNSTKYKSACLKMFGNDTLEYEEVARRVESWGNLFDEDSQVREIVVFMSEFDDKYMTRNKDEGTIDINVVSLVEFARDSNMSESTSLYLLYALNMFGEMNFSKLEISDSEALQLILAICDELNQTYDMSGFIGETSISQAAK